MPNIISIPSFRSSDIHSTAINRLSEFFGLISVGVMRSHAAHLLVQDLTPSLCRNAQTPGEAKENQLPIAAAYVIAQHYKKKAMVMSFHPNETFEQEWLGDPERRTYLFNGVDALYHRWVQVQSGELIVPGKEVFAQRGLSWAQRSAFLIANCGAIMRDMPTAERLAMCGHGITTGFGSWNFP